MICELCSQLITFKNFELHSKKFHSKCYQENFLNKNETQKKNNIIVLMINSLKNFDIPEVKKIDEKNYFESNYFYEIDKITDSFPSTESLKKKTKRKLRIKKRNILNIKTENLKIEKDFQIKKIISKIYCKF